jgi:hypothetical protein
VDERVDGLMRVVEGLLDELAHQGVPEERLRVYREELLALRIYTRMRAERGRPGFPWANPRLWLVLALLLAIVGAMMGLPVHKLFP